MVKDKTILIIGLCLLVLALFWWFEPCEIICQSLCGGKEPDLGIYSKQIENLQMQNDSLRANNRQLDNQVSRLKTETDSLMSLVSIDRHVISDLKKNERERIKAIDDFTNDELFLFFAKLETDSTAN